MYWEPRRIIAGFSYKFGSNLVKSARQRKSGLDEENRRTNENTGLN
ncbi:MAG TPA: hypothetical protein VK498_14950 [Ferruginibacter sp.]|nr:hypothetical protein [Ferruginibacter sp.]